MTMTGFIIFAAFAAALTTGVTVWLVLGAVDSTRRRVVANLRRGGVSVIAAHQGPQRSSPSWLGDLAHRVTPNLIQGVLERQHMLAGRPADWPLEKLLTLKLLWIPTAVLLNFVILVAGPPPLLVITALLVSVVVYFLPELLLNSEGQKRQEQIQLQLADTLDQMTIAVEAGLGFDAAMARAASNGKGALAEELVRTLQDIRMGHSRRQAFEALTTRTTVTDLRRFVRAVIQADAYGVSIAGVLRTQADEMRLKRRQRAEEKAQKLPVKILAPLMLFILPVLFIVVLGPAMIRIVEGLGGL